MFNGRTLNQTEFPKDLNWKDVSVVLVTGKSVNTCGHVLLYIGGGFGHYFHFDGPHQSDLPRYMQGDSEYRRFLKEAGKDELLRKRLNIPNPVRAEEQLRIQMSHKWWTLLVVHNCASFVILIVNSGGNFWTFSEQCPVLGMGWELWFERLFSKWKNR